MLWLVVPLGVLIGVVGFGAIYQALATSRDSLMFLPPGKLIQINGENGHCQIMGKGHPTVIVDSGTEIPQKYGAVLSLDWRSQWLLEESNAELRRLLIQGIGYKRIVQELDAVELDAWREYSLLKIQADIDVEPIHLLKMTCPSTNHIHVLRVPPDLTSAHEATRWVNWDIDPETFAVES